MLITTTIATYPNERLCKIEEVYLQWLFSKKLKAMFQAILHNLIAAFKTD